MIIGCLISFLIFGGLAYFMSKLALNMGFDKDNRFLAALFYFLVPLFSLALLSCIVVAIYSMMGFSVSLIAEAIAAKVELGSSGALVVIGSIITTVLGITAIAAGPASAFTASQVSGAVAVVTILVKQDREFCNKWLPIVAGATYGFCMWPFAAILTFGL